MRSTDCAIVIPYWNAPADLQKCLESIRSSSNMSGLAVSVIIVDNGDVHFNEPMDDLRVRYIRIRRSLGFARAVNIGLYTALEILPELIIILNQDTILKEDFLVNAHRHSSDTQTLYFPLVHDIGTNTLTEWYKNRYYSNVSMYILKRRSGLAKLELASGICIIAKHAAIKMAGYFDPNFDMYYEDTDYFERFKRRGGQLMLIADCAVEHVGQSSARLDPTRSQNARWKRNSRVYLAWKQGNTFRVLSMMLRSYARCLLHLDFPTLITHLQKDIDLLKLDRNIVRDHASLQSVAMRCIQDDLQFLDETV